MTPPPLSSGSCRRPASQKPPKLTNGTANSNHADLPGLETPVRLLLDRLDRLADIHVALAMLLLVRGVLVRNGIADLRADLGGVRHGAQGCRVLNGFRVARGG